VVSVLDLACSYALVAIALGAMLAYGVRVSRRGAARFARVDRAGHSPLLGTPAMQMGYWTIAPLARAVAAAGVTANAVSWASLVLAAAAGGALALGRFGVGAALSLASSCCDALDGMIARETGTASDAGEVLDAAIDRYAEFFFFGGVAVYEHADARVLSITLAAAAGAMMVSYATAKAEALGVDAPRGAMRRPERAVYLVLGAALVPLAGVLRARTALPDGAEQAPLIAVLALIAVVANVSAIGRLAAVARAVRARSPTEVARAPGSGQPGGGVALAGDAHGAPRSAFR
jgi:CDP-diacylglycerol--glycerol-3-phosphate 3-phosphatidyltransferase